MATFEENEWQRRCEECYEVNEKLISSNRGFLEMVKMLREENGRLKGNVRILAEEAGGAGAVNLAHPTDQEIDALLCDVYAAIDEYIEEIGVPGQAHETEELKRRLLYCMHSLRVRNGQDHRRPL